MKVVPPSESDARAGCSHQGLTCPPADGVLWTRVNTGELMPGIMKPFAWSYYAYGVESGLRRGFHHLGLIDAGESIFPLPVRERIVASFHGRLSGNVNVARRIFGALPGVSGDDIERDLLGSVRDRIVDDPPAGRMGALMTRIPAVMFTGGRQAREHHARVEAWWRACVDGNSLREGLDPIGTAHAALAEFITTLRLQIWMRVFGQAVSAQLAAVADFVGRPEIVGTLLGGAAATEEARIADDLFHVATGRKSLDRFIADHGYQGPNSGDPAARVWREDRRPVERLLDALATAEPPAERRARMVADRRRTVEAVLAQLPVHRRPLARLAVHLAPIAARSIEGTKTSMLRTVDVGRAAARVVGAEMVAARITSDVDDVFHLYCDEIAEWNGRHVAATIDARKELHAAFLTEDFPETWEGEPVVGSRPESPTADVTTVRGLGVSPGTVQGRVRIVRDAADDVTIDNGDILVCPTTDPGWVSLMTLAGALVIDLGAAGSHGAIVARELGVPCVAGTRSGTRDLRDGDIVRVDGSSGIVEVVQRQPVQTAHGPQ